jgi:hypothetical protein
VIVSTDSGGSKLKTNTFKTLSSERGNYCICKCILTKKNISSFILHVEST